jgi:hypothetical protein
MSDPQGARDVSLSPSAIMSVLFPRPSPTARVSRPSGIESTPIGDHHVRPLRANTFVLAVFRSRLRYGTRTRPRPSRVTPASSSVIAPMPFQSTAMLRRSGRLAALAA